MGSINITSQEKPNLPPVVNAGADITLQLPASSTSLLATASDPDGYITSVQWTKVNGGAGTIVSPNSLATDLVGLQLGNYTFQILVYDNYGASATSTVQVIVKNYQIYPFIWVAGSTTCESVNGSFTGRLKYVTLKKVSRDEGYPLDINNQRITDSMLAQDIKNNVDTDPDYVPPFEDLTACPRNRFYSAMAQSKSWNSGITAPGLQPCGAVFKTGSLDNATVIENTLSGAVLKNFDSPNGVAFVIPTTGNYKIEVKGSGTAAISFVNASTRFTAPLDFILKINNAVYDLSPINPAAPPAGWEDCPLQYCLGKDSTYGQGPAISFTLNKTIATIALNAGDVIDMFFKLRMVVNSTEVGRNGQANVTLNTCTFEVKQL